MNCLELLPWAGEWGIVRGGSEGEKWLRSIFLLVEEKGVSGVRTGRRCAEWQGLGLRDGGAV